MLNYAGFLLVIIGIFVILIGIWSLHSLQTAKPNQVDVRYWLGIVGFILGIGILLLGLYIIHVYPLNHPMNNTVVQDAHDMFLWNENQMNAAVGLNE